MTIEGKVAPELEAAFNQFTAEFNRRVIESDLYRRATDQARAEGKKFEEDGYTIIMFGEGPMYWIIAVVASEDDHGISFAKADKVAGVGRGVETARGEGILDLYYGESSGDHLQEGVEIKDPSVVLQKAQELFAEFESFNPTNLEIHEYMH